MKREKTIQKVKSLCNRIHALESLDNNPSIQQEIDRAYKRMGDIINAELDKCVCIKLSDMKDLRNRVEQMIQKQGGSSSYGMVLYQGWHECLDYLMGQLDR